MNKDFKHELGDAVKANILHLIRRPSQPVKVTKPKNRASEALIGFNLVMTFLDLISSLAVGFLTTPLYGVLTFIAGVGALLLWERLFTNAHANKMQKILAVIGGLVAVFATLAIGVASGIVNVLGVVGKIDVSVFESVMVVSLVCFAFLHGIGWGVYYFTDPTHVAEMKRMISIAFREQQKQGIADAKEDVQAVLDIAKELDDYEKRGELEYLNAAFEELRGQSLVSKSPDVNSPEYQQWLKKGAVTPSPLSDLDGESG